MSATGRARRVAILGHSDRPEVRRAAARLVRSLARRRCAIRLEARIGAALGLEGFGLPALGRWCEILIALGGDGTALAGARALARRRGVLLPINLGGLGFLTVAEAPEADGAVEASLAARWPVARRAMVRAAVRRRGRVVARGFAMNDVVMKGVGGYAAIHLRVRALDHDLGRVLADGLIVASATGSTAYSLSAGGPVLAPDVEAMVVTPVCAHSLGSRSLVLDPGTELAIQVLGSSDRTVLLFDGQERVAIEPRDDVRARLELGAVRVFRNPERPFTDHLRRKLGWQGSARRSFGR